MKQYYLIKELFMSKNKYTFLILFISFFLFTNSSVKKQNIVTKLQNNSNKKQFYLSFKDENSFINACHSKINVLQNEEIFHSMFEIFEELNNKKNSQ